MANGGEKSNDFYAVLGLEKECTASDLRNAYKKLALRWHPDRCSASGNSKFVEEAKKKFQAIQQAYSVLSDESKRFLYDVGVYDSDDDENGMGDFLNEMAVMMSQTKPNEGGEETFEELQQLFEDMFQGDTETFGSGSSYCESSASSSSYYSESSSSNSKRSSSEMNNGNTNLNSSSSFAAHFQTFCVGTGGASSAGYEGGEQGKRRSSRRSKR
ncbi:dnaJ homolog subfamily B member 7 isoform X2 [Morus notabilis]|uniref:dnaJ homolog subfamily B member 7 isoform X2 n=1 Tax=Morus notabilis TaxID=981085 RepID=UPI000CECF50F|nr:dnaJ homolog subfamily B member 7 isoform X2 [Morus notabilis]